MDSDVSLCSVGTFRQVSCLVDNFGATAEVARFDLIMGLAFANNIILLIKNRELS